MNSNYLVGLTSHQSFWFFCPFKNVLLWHCTLQCYCSNVITFWKYPYIWDTEHFTNFFLLKRLGPPADDTCSWRQLSINFWPSMFPYVLCMSAVAGFLTMLSQQLQSEGSRTTSHPEGVARMQWGLRLGNFQKFLEMFNFCWMHQSFIYCFPGWSFI